MSKKKKKKLKNTGAYDNINNNIADNVDANNGYDVDDNYGTDDSIDEDIEGSNNNYDGDDIEKGKKPKKAKKDKKPVDKSTIISIALIAAAILVVAGLIAVIVLGVNKGKVKLFTDSDYPCWYKQKDENVIFKVNGKITADSNWKIETDNDSIEVSGKEGGGKIKYTLSPKNAGICNIKFYKTKEVAGYEYEQVAISVPAYVEETVDGLIVRIYDYCNLADNGGADGGKNTDYPYVLLNQSDKTGKIFFVNGESDWTITAADSKVFTEWVAGADGKSSIVITDNYSYDSEASTEEIIVDDKPQNTEEPNVSDEDTVTTEGEQKALKDPETITITGDDISADKAEDGMLQLDLSEYMVDGNSELTPDVEKALEKKLNEALGETDDEESTQEKTESQPETFETDGTTEVDPNKKEKETILTISSKSLNVTEYIRVVVKPDGKVMLYKSTKGPK